METQIQQYTQSENDVEVMVLSRLQTTITGIQVAVQNHKGHIALIYTDNTAEIAELDKPPVLTETVSFIEVIEAVQGHRPNTIKSERDGLKLIPTHWGK